MSPLIKRVLVLGLAVLFLSAIYVVRIRNGMADFAVSYRAGQRLATGQTLYQTGDGHYMFKYLPSSALLYIPLSALPLEIAKPIWFGISLTALLWMFLIVRQLVPRQHIRYAWAIAGLILAKYFLHELRLGQINILVTLVMLLAARTLSQATDARQEIVAGVLVGLATALKPYSALLFPYLIVKRQWRGAAAGLAFLLAALAIPSVFYGAEGNMAVLMQWGATLSRSTPAQLTNNDNVSVVAFFTKWTADPTRALVLTGVVLSVLAALVLAVVARGRKQDALVLEWAMMLTLIPLVSPLGWDYTFLMALLATTLLVNFSRSFPRPAQVVLAVNFAVIAFAVYDLMGRAAYAVFMQWSVTTVNFLVVVAGLTYLRFRRVC